MLPISAVSRNNPKLISNNITTKRNDLAHAQ
jgi:hypothetical protein